MLEALTTHQCGVGSNLRVNSTWVVLCTVSCSMRLLVSLSSHYLTFSDSLSFGNKDGTVLRVLTSHQCDPDSNPDVDAICGLSLLLVFFLAPKSFSLETLVLPSSQKTTLPNSNSTRNQVDEEPLCGCPSSKSLFIYLLIYLFISLGYIRQRKTLGY